MFGLPINDSLLNSLYRYSDTVSMQPIRKAEQCLRKGNFILSPIGVVAVACRHYYTCSARILKKALPNNAPNGYNKTTMNMIAEFVKTERKKAGLTQEEFAMRSGLGLRFVRDLEQGKKTVRMDKVNQALAMFGMEAVPGKADDEIE